MKKIKKVSYVPWLGTPINNKVFSLHKSSWEYILKKKLQKNGIDIQTHDQLPIEKADAAVVFDNIFYKNLKVMWELYNNKLLHKTVYIDYEPPTGHCKQHSKEGLRKLSSIFGKIITYNDDLIDDKKFIKGCIANFYDGELKYKNDFNNRKFMCMITNNTGLAQIIGISNYCNTSIYFNEDNMKDHPNQIYSERLKAAMFFAEFYPDDFHLYGVHWPETLNYVLQGYLAKSDKLKTIAEYKFIISYDSIINQRGYVSEKIFDCFKAKTVPIYWGAENVTDYIPKECFVDRRDFENYDELAAYLNAMTKKEYDGKIAAIEKYLKSDAYLKLFSSQASADTIYSALVTESSDFSYEEAYEALCELQKKKDEVDKKRAIYTYYNPNEDNYHSSKLLLGTEYNDFEKPDITLITKINNKEVETDLYEKVYNEDNDCYRYAFFIKLSGEKYKTKIDIYEKNNETGEIRQLYINFCGLKETNPERFKNIKVKGKSLYYRTVFNKNIFIKGVWLLRYNLRGVDRAMCSQRRIIRVPYKLLRLPFMCALDIIKIFKDL